MLTVVLQSLWLSAAVAISGILHMVVVKADLAPSLKRPIDGGRTLRGRPIFGPNKTWRGFFFMVISSAAAGAVQGLLFGPWAARSGAACLRYDGVARPYAAGYAMVNAALGFGYAMGELPNSFLKRQLDFRPGETRRSIAGLGFLVLDQADSVLFGLGLGAPSCSRSRGSSRRRASSR
ncbi:MAG: CDP-archaeol synthase [Acidobacteriota bacterium]